MCALQVGIVIPLFLYLNLFSGQFQNITVSEINLKRVKVRF